MGILNKLKPKKKVELKSLLLGLYKSAASINFTSCSLFFELLKSYCKIEEGRKIIPNCFYVQKSDGSYIEIPEISLVTPSILQMKTMKTNFSVHVSDVQSIEQIQNDQVIDEFANFYVSITSTKKKEKENFVDVEVVFESHDPPENYMRILENLGYQDVLKK